MSKHLDLVFYSNCSREFSLEIDGVPFDVLPVSSISGSKRAVFLLFPPLEALGNPLGYLQQWGADLRGFITTFEDYTGAAFMFQGFEAIVDDAEIRHALEDHFGIATRSLTFNMFDFDPVWVTVLERMVRVDVSMPLAYDEALSLCEVIAEERQDEFFNSLLVEAWLAGGEQLSELRAQVDKSQCEFEGLSLQYQEAQQQLEDAYLELSALKRPRTNDEMLSPIVTSEAEASEFLFDVKSKVAALAHHKKAEPQKLDIQEDDVKLSAVTQEKELLLVQMTQNQQELESLYIENHQLRTNLSERLPFKARDLLPMVLKHKLSESQESHSLLFDNDYYLGQFKTKVNPFLHYRFYGWKHGAEPHPLFDSTHYLEQLGILPTELKMSPLVHFFRIGSQIQADTHRHFDAKFYLNEYPDVLRSKVPAVLHYISFGWKEGRNPSSSFCTTSYLESYPDVAESQMNPLVHYVLFGEAEGRLAGKR